MKAYNKDTISVLAYLLEYNFIRYEKAIEWAYDQYAYENIPDWIERLSLEASVSGMIGILREEFSIVPSGEYTDQYVSEIAKLFIDGAIKESDLSILLFDYMEVDSDFSSAGEPVYIRFFGLENGIDYRTEVIYDINMYFIKLAKDAYNDYSKYIRT